jgi:hypothetical protein
MAEAEFDQIAQRQRAVEATIANLGIDLSSPLSRNGVNAIPRFHATDAQRPKRALAKYILANLRSTRRPKVLVNCVRSLDAAIHKVEDVCAKICATANPFSLCRETPSVRRNCRPLLPHIRTNCLASLGFLLYFMGLQCQQAVFSCRLLMPARSR